MTDDERNDRILDLAREQWHKEGEIEIDDDPGEALADGHTINIPAISEGDDNGAYVRCWCWVSFEGTDLDKESEDNE